MKVVQLKRQDGRAVLETYGAVSLGPYAQVDIGRGVKSDPAIISKAIADLTTEANLTTRNAVIAIPLRSSLLTLIELPGIAGANLEDIIKLEARKYIPVPITEVQLDWTVIPKNDSARFEQFVAEDKQEEFAGATEVLLLAIHNNVISNYQQMVSQAKLTAKAYEIEVFSAIRATFSRDITATMLIDFGASSTKIVIVDYGIVRMSHTINRGAQDITFALSKSMNISFEKAEELKQQGDILSNEQAGYTVGPTIDYLFFEANRVLLSYQKKYRRTVDKIILVGGGAHLAGLRDRAQLRFSADVRLGNAFERVQAPAFLQPMLSNLGPEFAVAVGTALRGIQELR